MPSLAGQGTGFGRAAPADPEGAAVGDDRPLLPLSSARGRVPRFCREGIVETIGILGGFGPEATTVFENRILTEARALVPPDKGFGYPPVVGVHLRHAPILLGDDGRARQPLQVDPRLLDAARRLGGWADFLVIVANTPHLFVEEIAAAAGRDVLSMIDVVVDELRDRPGPVGLLGLGVPQTYTERFDREGIEFVAAPPEVRAPLDDAIFRTMELSVTETHRAAARTAVQNLRVAGARTIVLGCTEIPLLLGPEAEGPDLVDPGALLARAAVRRAIG
jgi:aspartate racemase